jgi:hypothetical protein
MNLSHVALLTSALAIATIGMADEVENWIQSAQVEITIEMQRIQCQWRQWTSYFGRLVIKDSSILISKPPALEWLLVTTHFWDTICNHSSC